jgi:hypothetical protein
MSGTFQVSFLASLAYIRSSERLLTQTLGCNSGQLARSSFLCGESGTFVDDRIDS